jgi:hypothetical protein
MLNSGCETSIWLLALRCLAHRNEAIGRTTATMTRIALALLFCTAAIALPLHAASTMAPAKIYAQELVNQTVAKNPDLLVVAMHVTPPNGSQNEIIASNIGRIGKKADADDMKVITTGETLAKVN